MALSIMRELVVTLTLALVFVDAKPNLLELAKDLNLNEFVRAAKATGLDRIINHEGNFTIFAPSDDAFAHERKYPNEATLGDKIRFHLGRGLYKQKDLRDEGTIEALLHHRTIRINVYPNEKMTANGRVIESFDHEATNGVIHVLSSVMSSIYDREGSVVSELDDCCPQHSTLLELVKTAGLYGMLDEKGPFTLIAPLNSGFEKLHPDFIIHLRKNLTALRTFLLGHVVPHTWYSPGFEDGQFLKTVVGNQVKVRVKNGEVTLGKGRVTLPDITAGNGVVHVLDEVLFPKYYGELETTEKEKVEEVKTETESIVELCRSLGLTSFADALVRTRTDRLLHRLRKLRHGVTVLAPSNEVFDNNPEKVSLLQRVQFHIGRGIVKPSKIKDGDRMRSLLGGRYITFNKYYTGDNGTELTLANGRRVVFTQYQTPEGVLHLLPDGAMDHVYETDSTWLKDIRKIARFSKFATIIRQSGMDVFLKQATPVTVFVISNRVVDRLRDHMSEESIVTHLFSTHFVHGTWYEEGLRTQGHVRSMAGEKINMGWSDEGLTQVNGASIIHADYSTLDGVFHEVDDLL